MAHGNFDQLKILIAQLDHPRNDIYLHVDKKSTDFRAENFQTEFSKLVIIDRIRVNWGGHSQIQCELNLMKAAASGHYQYYHLLSGLDLPIKPQQVIHVFFDENNGKNYLSFDVEANRTGSFLYRTCYWHPFQNIFGRNRGKFYGLLRRVEKLLQRLQEKFRLERKPLIPLYKGTNWFSITDDLVQYVLTQEKLIKKQFFFSKCADEVFLHSVAMASPYRDTIVRNSLRAIDWKRGSPYTYTREDVDTLISSPALFARKFDEIVDQTAIAEVVRRTTADLLLTKE